MKVQKLWCNRETRQVVRIASVIPITDQLNQKSEWEEENRKIPTKFLFNVFEGFPNYYQGKTAKNEECWKLFS